jgi:signal peptidase II
VLAADQLSKALVRASIPLGAERHLMPGVALLHTRNEGVAFGLRVGGTAALAGLVAVALALLAVYFARNWRRRLAWLPTGMILGGALGNVVDRVREGFVTDFIKLPLGWPAFNVADASITVGVVCLILLIGLDDAHRRRALPAPTRDGAGEGAGGGASRPAAGGAGGS